MNTCYIPKIGVTTINKLASLCGNCFLACAIKMILLHENKRMLDTLISY